MRQGPDGKIFWKDSKKYPYFCVLLAVFCCLAEAMLVPFGVLRFIQIPGQLAPVYALI